MKTWILTALMLSAAPLAHAATQDSPVLPKAPDQAEKRDWQAELETYRASLPAKSNSKLILLHAGNTAMAMGACSASAAITGASFVAETLPIVNAIPEIVANGLDPEYKTFDFTSIFSWAALTEAGRGTVGGGVIVIKDALKFITLWLSGQESRSFDAAKKIYASSFVNAEELFAHQGKCVMSLSKIVILGTEMEKRGMQIPQPDPNALM